MCEGASKQTTDLRILLAPGLEIPGSATDIDNNSISRICDYTPRKQCLGGI